MEKKGSILPAVIAISVVALLILMVLFVSGSINTGLRTSIAQNIKIYSYADETYSVSTTIWVKKNFLELGEIETSYYDRDVACKDIPAIREKQMAWAKRTQAKIELALETFEECEHL